MKLILKFNLIFALVFSAGLAGAGYISYGFLQRSAREQVAQQARLMMETGLSARKYTTTQIKPLLETQQAHQISFLPQTVPAFAATESFGYLQAEYPDYSYKEATLNPTNLRDRAVDWEADVVNTFRNHAGQKEIESERDTPTGRSMFLARPISAAPPCLECHDTPRRAPAAMIRRYGREHGFEWKAGEIVGAQIVSVPMAVPLNMANAAFRTTMLVLILVVALILVALNLALAIFVVRPVSRVAQMADEISKGNLKVPELPVRGSDEISMLIGAFNRMHVSLSKAIEMLNQKS